MDSGSLQSSSGGDEEEYDSRATASLFMTNHPPPPYSAFSSNPLPPPFFDPLSNYMQLHHHNPNSLLLNQPISWPGTTSLRSDPNSSNTISVPSFQTPPASAVGEDNRHVPVAPAAQTAARKKRSRASRRAPTTVLTTDTNNFRAMVQEFTGIPAQPFDNSSFKRTRLDLFGLRPTAPPPLPPFLSSASFSSANNITSNPNLFNVDQNPILSSLLQSNPRFMFSNPSASKPDNQSSFEIPSNRTGGLDEFGLRDGGHVSGLPNLISPDGKDAEGWKKDGDGEKMNDSTGDKEGMVGSWVCSSE